MPAVTTAAQVHRAVLYGNADMLGINQVLRADRLPQAALQLRVALNIAGYAV